MGERLNNLKIAVFSIEKYIGRIVKSSKIYETDAWGITEQPAFLNQVVFSETELAPCDVLQLITEIERQIGRIRYQKWAERIIDIDILYYDKVIINTDILKIPHPEIQNRRFTLVPLADIAPNFIHPVLKKSSIQLLQESIDPLHVKEFDETKPQHL